MNRIKILEVTGGSIADEAGIEPGDILLSINGKAVKDIFDYRLFLACENVLVEVEKKDGSILRIDIEKDEDEDIGLLFENPLMDKERHCRNKCIFCFIDQLPRGMRKSLYYKDDDVRLSFLFGNYVTMTNIDHDELNRIIKHRLSPVNVSVHTTNPELRVYMMGNKNAGDVLSKMKLLAEGGISLNAQIVLCRGINDGTELDKTLDDLSGLIPSLKSVSVVPIGLTRFRDNLPQIRPYDKKSALSVISQVEEWQRNFKKRTGSRIVFLADEWYLMTGTRLPEYEHYEDFPQLENGVGMVPLLIQEFSDALQSGKKPYKKGTVSIATGTSSFSTISMLAKQAENHYPGVKVHVYPIINEFFGNTVTVTGLLTGMDIYTQLKEKPLGDRLLLCSTMFRAGTCIFLDDMSLDKLSGLLNIRAVKVENNGEALLDAITAVSYTH
ncbi:MAG TPA: radical SAM protein, partial [Ruminiclostridium sp.]|nr:radical SAM protein [Ruminiclostridium sp.]